MQNSASPADADGLTVNPCQQGKGAHRIRHLSVKLQCTPAIIRQGAILLAGMAYRSAFPAGGRRFPFLPNMSRVSASANRRTKPCEHTGKQQQCARAYTLCTWTKFVLQRFGFRVHCQKVCKSLTTTDQPGVAVGLNQHFRRAQALVVC